LKILIELMNLSIINIHSYKCNANLSANEEHGVLLPHPLLVNINGVFCSSFWTQNKRKLEIIIELQENGDGDDEVMAKRSTKIGAYIEMVLGAGLAIISFHPVLKGLFNGGQHWERCDTTIFLPVPPATIFLIMGRHGGINPMGGIYTFLWDSHYIDIGERLYRTWNQQVQESRRANQGIGGSHNYLNW
jgi:hypothetical protein